MNHDRIDCFCQVMRKEAALFEIILAEEKLMTLAIRERKWESLEKAIRGIDALEGELAQVESEREGIFDILKKDAGLGADANFYTWAVRLPTDIRDGITELYRCLKSRAMAARAQGTAIAGYLTESRTVLAGIMEELFPQRRGKIYDKRGGHRESEMTKVILDQAY